MASLKNLTRAMKMDLSKKCRIKVDEYGYTKNTTDIIELLHRTTGESIIIDKSKYNLKF